MEAENDHLAVAFKIHLDAHTPDDMHDRKKELLCSHVAENLGCDHVEICTTPGSAVVDALAVGFVRDDDALQAAEKISSGQAVLQDVWGMHSVPDVPRHTTKLHRASRWLQLQRSQSDNTEVDSGSFLRNRSSSTSTCGSASTDHWASRATQSSESLGSLATQSLESLAEGTPKTVRRTVSFAPSPCNSTVEITPYSQMYDSDDSPSGSPANESKVPTEDVRDSFFMTPSAYNSEELTSSEASPAKADPLATRIVTPVTPKRPPQGPSHDEASPLSPTTPSLSSAPRCFIGCGAFGTLQAPRLPIQSWEERLERLVGWKWQASQGI